jgi:hypothetical protein
MLNQIANDFGCPLQLRIALKEYGINKTHANWIKLSQAFTTQCPCENKCPQCDLLRNIVFYVLTHEK